MAAARPTRVRFRIVTLVVSLAMITDLDRACIAALMPDLMRDRSGSKAPMSWYYSVKSPEKIRSFS